MMDLLYCETTAKQTCSHLYILVIISICPPGFRTVLRQALNTPKLECTKPCSEILLSSFWGCDCLGVSPLCHHYPSLTKTCVCVCVCVYCFHAQIMLFTSTRVHTSVSVFVYVASLLQTDGNLRHNAGGLSFEAPLPPAHSPPRPLPATPHPHHFPPSHLSAHQAEKKASILHRQAPEPDCRQWNPLQLLWRYKSSPVFDTITQTERERKCRCNIHIRITRLAAM